MLAGLCTENMGMHLRFEFWILFTFKLLLLFFSHLFIYNNNNNGFLYMQAFKSIVNDPDSVLKSLTREVKHIGPDGKEVILQIDAFAHAVFSKQQYDLGFPIHFVGE